MKTIKLLNLLNPISIRNIILIVFFGLIDFTVIGQTTYTCNPASGSFTNSTSTNITCNNFNPVYTSYGQGAIKMKVTISGNQATFRIQKIAAGNFSNAGTAYIKQDDACGAVIGNSNGVGYSTSQNYVDISITLTHTSGTLYFCGMIKSTSAGWRNHTLPISITASTPPSITLWSNQSFGTSSLITGTQYTYSVTIKNTGTTAWSGNLFVKQGGTDWIGIAVSPSIAAGQTRVIQEYFTPVSSDAGNNLPVTLYFQTGGTGSGSQVISGSYTNPITVSVCQAVSEPALSSPSNAYTYSNTPGSITYQWTKNNNSGVATYKLKVRDITTDDVNGPIEIDQNVGDVSSYTPNITYYSGKTYRWVITAIGGCSQIDDSPAWTFSISSAPSITLWSNHGFGTSSLVIGTQYSYSATIKNTGTTAWSGSLFLKQGSTDWIGMSVSPSIAAGQTRPIQGMFTPGSSDAGNNLPVTLYFQTGGVGNGSPVTSGSYSNPITVNVIGSTCYFSDCSSTSNCGNTNYQDQTYNAIQYLCAHHIVKGDAGKADPDTLISRAQLAKILLYGIYGDSLNVPSLLVSDFFPSPYPDLQTTTTYFYRAAKALLYLEYTNGISPYDRGRVNFSPAGKISRRWVIKAMLEAFNILPATSGTNPFTDDGFNSTVDGWGYAKKASDLGITTASLFRPYANCTRAEAFIFLHRILTTQSLPQINNTIDPATSSFFIPGNISPSSFAAGKGMETGNFNHYTKSSFNIPGRNVTLDFEHAYNSVMTELPVDLFPVNPLGDGWTHTYNSYIQKVEGETIADDRWIVLWPDASFNSYYKTGGTYNCETKGVYDTYTEVSSTVFTIKTKGQVTYTFTKIGSFNNVFFLTGISDRNNNTITITYEIVNSAPRVKEVTDPANRKLEFTYHSGSDLLWQVTDPLTRAVTFLYSTNRLTSFKDAKDQTTIYNYGTTPAEAGLLKNIQLPKGNIINNEYVQRKLTSTKFNNNHPTTIAHYPNYQTGSSDFYKSTVTIPQQSGQNVTTNYEINKNGNLTKASGNPALNISSQYTNSTHPSLPSDIRNNNNGVTITPTYDSKGNITQINTTGGSINTNEYFQYNTYNDVTQHTDANGNVTYYSYTNGNLTKVKDALNNETNISNNNYGQPTTITNPNGIIVNFGYNSYGNQNQVSIPSLSLTSTSIFDAASRMTSTTNFNGQTSSLVYDNNDNLISETNALNLTTTYDYDLNDNKTSITNAKGYSTTFTYDSLTDWLLTESFQGAVKTYTYNYDGSLQTYKNPNNEILTYAYDNAGRITNDGYSTYSYLSNGNLSTITKGGKAITFGYDDLNRVNSVTYDGNAVTYTYDNVGNLLTMTYPGSKTVTYTYDAANKMKTVKDWNNNTTTYNYRADGQLDYVLLPNAVKTTYSYDNAGRNTGQSTKRNTGTGTSIADYTFTLDQLGNHTQENITEPYAAYIPVANQTINYTYNSANRITNAGFGFDNNGNTTTKTGYTFAYDVLNNLNSVSGNLNANYVYDGAGNRREATRNSVNTKFVLDILGMSNVLMETDAGGTVQNYYVYGLGLVSRIKPNNITEYYVYDFRGSTVAMVDASANAAITHKYQYDDFGKVIQIQENDINPFRYVGKYGVMYEDSTLQFMRARYYDNSIGRFLSEDPVWSTNLYPYADNNSLKNVDPLGTYIDIAFQLNNELATNNGEFSLFDGIKFGTTLAKEALRETGYLKASKLPIGSALAIGEFVVNKDKNLEAKCNLAIAVQLDVLGYLGPVGFALSPIVSAGVPLVQKGWDFLEDSYLKYKYNKKKDKKLLKKLMSDPIKYKAALEIFNANLK